MQGGEEFLDQRAPQRRACHDERHVERLDDVSDPVFGRGGGRRVLEIGSDGEHGFGDAGVCVEAAPAGGDFFEGVGVEFGVGEADEVVGAGGEETQGGGAAGVDGVAGARVSEGL